MKQSTGGSINGENITRHRGKSRFCTPFPAYDCSIDPQNFYSELLGESEFLFDEVTLRYHEIHPTALQVVL